MLGNDLSVQLIKKLQRNKLKVITEILGDLLHKTNAEFTNNNLIRYFKVFFKKSD